MNKARTGLTYKTRSNITNNLMRWKLFTCKSFLSFKIIFLFIRGDLYVLVKYPFLIKMLLYVKSIIYNDVDYTMVFKLSSMYY